MTDMIDYKSMRVLHLSNGFADSKVHSNLTKALDQLCTEQTVYCPVREERFLEKNQFEGKHTSFVYSYCIKPWYKYVYLFKQWMLYRDLERKVSVKDHDVIHATTLFSDGGLALRAYKKYGIPYVVAVRNTDINIYIRRLKHTHHMGREIVCNASRVIFISKGELKEFEESRFVTPILEKIKDKLVFLPNGIEDFWHDHISREERKGHDVLYVGDFTPNKNVVRLANAIIELRQEKGFEDVRLIIVGGDKVGLVWHSDERIKQIIDDHPEAIKALGKVYDRGKLSQIMRSCALLAMPSIHETFGLVYIEALSQNLPIVYTKGQGIDGVFDTTVGLGVNPFSEKEIRDAIRTILSRPAEFGNRNVVFDDFNWNTIANKYIEIYNEIKKN